MNPNDDSKPATPAPDMSAAPSTPSPSDEAALQAIEALEAEGNAMSETPVADPVPETVAPATPVPTPPTEPSVTPPLTPSTPMINEPLVTTDPAPATPQPAAEPQADSSPVAAGITASLKEAAPTSSGSFQPFEQKKKSKLPLIILIVVLGLVLLGGGGYVAWQYFGTQNQAAPSQSSSESPTPTQPVDETTVSSDSVESDINDITTQLDGIDDSDYEDATLSDASLTTE